MGRTDKNVQIQPELLFWQFGLFFCYHGWTVEGFMYKMDVFQRQSDSLQKELL